MELVVELLNVRSKEVKCRYDFQIHDLGTSVMVVLKYKTQEEQQVCGEICSSIVDTFGYLWNIHMEKVSDGWVWSSEERINWSWRLRSLQCFLCVKYSCKHSHQRSSRFIRGLKRKVHHCYYHLHFTEGEIQTQKG